MAFKLAVLTLALFVALTTASWDAYIGNLIAQSKDISGNANVDRASIIGLDGGSPWTTANSLTLSRDEAAKVAKVFESDDFSAFMTSGIVLEGVKYEFLRVENSKVAYGKKKGKGAVTLQATNKAVVIAHMPEGGQQGNMNKAVAVIADYLEGKGY